MKILQKTESSWDADLHVLSQENTKVHKEEVYMVPSLMKCFILIMLENIIEKLYGLVLCVSRENKS